MDDLISRQALMKEFADFVRKSNNSDFARTPTWNDAVSLAGSMPSAQTDLSEFIDWLYKKAYEQGRAERRGKWIPDRTIEFETIGTWHKFVCDQCGNAEFVPEDWDMQEQNAYCRKCGARME